jgi:TPR repeat protein
MVERSHEVAMTRVPGFLLLAALAAFAVTISFAQAGIDPAVLAKANAGDAVSQVAVGANYAQTAGSTQDQDDAAEAWKQSAEWYAKAAAQNYVPGEIRLAEAYSYGRGVERDPAKAAAFYRKAADQGDVGAQGTLAMLYTMGQGVPQSDVDAYFWFDLAAAVNSPNQDRYITNRQNVGTRITTDELEAVREREKKWKAEHPR